MSNDDEIIRKRLLIDGDGSGDERRFNTLMKLFTKWCNSNDSDNSMLQRMLSVLSQCEFAMTKSTLVHQMNVEQMNRYEDLQNQIGTNVESAVKEIETCKEEVKAAKLERKNRQEYDALAKIVLQHSDRGQSTDELNVLNIDLEELQKNQLNLEKKLQLRKKQFFTLLTTVKSLQEMLQDEDLNEVEDAEMTEDEAMDVK